MTTNTPTTAAPAFNTLEELQQRKEELRASLRQESQQAGLLWHTLADPKPSNSKGELISNLISNSITAIDAFLLARKLMKTYGSLFHRKKK